MTFVLVPTKRDSARGKLVEVFLRVHFFVRVIEKSIDPMVG